MKWIVYAGLLFTAPAHAQDFLGVGYNNPVRTTLGVNWMHLWTHLAFEAGAGVNHRPESGHNSLAFDADLKYLFTSGFIRPFVQGGLSASSSSPDAFFGGGFFMMGFKMNLYFAATYAKQFSLQLGVSFP